MKLQDHQLFIRPIWEDEDFTSEWSDESQTAAHVYAWENHSKLKMVTRPIKTLFLYGT